MTARWSRSISTQRIKTEDYTVKSETIGSNPYHCQWAKRPFTSHVANSYIIVIVSAPLNSFSQTDLRSRAVWGVYKAKFWLLLLLQISLKTQTETTQKTHLSFLKNVVFLMPAISLKRLHCAFWTSEVGNTKNFINLRVNPSSCFVLSASGLHDLKEKLCDTAYSQRKSGRSTQPCF